MQAKLGTTEFYNQFPQVKTVTSIDANGNSVNLNVLDQHYTMAANYVDDLKNSILSFNPSFPEPNALALAKGGIINDSGISAANYAEKNSTNDAVGTKCVY